MLPLGTLCRHALALFVACLVTASAMTAVGAPSALLPLILPASFAVALLAFRPLHLVGVTTRLQPAEWAVFGLAVFTALLRLAAYAPDGFDGHLATAVTFDDNWHFQELASLVTSERFPPRLNFAPQHHLHFYYLPWMPAAALSHLLLMATGAAWLKLSYALGVLLLNVLSAAVLIAFVRHAVDAGARTLALSALLLAGAIPDGIAAVNNWTSGTLDHAEWWQDRFYVHSQFSTLTTTLIWVPHHLAAAAALLLAVVVISKPQSLELRNDPRAFVAAGLLVGFAAFSSIFAVIGGVVALSPLIIRVLGAPRLAALAALAALTSLPLAYIYLDSGASGGFLLLETFERWKANFASSAAGLLGIIAALLFMTAETGWLFVLARWNSTPAERHTLLGRLALASFAYLVSTAVVSFAVWNNYAMRGAIMPTVILSCWLAGVMHRRRPEARAPAAAMAFAVAAFVALATHANEMGVFARACWQSLRAEADECERGVLTANAVASRPIPPLIFARCAASDALYSLEWPFSKPVLRPEDRELMGHATP
ncbi:MAG: hypothetical protein ACT4N2_14315 [Hyphomicrobium sp.]